MRDCNEDSFGRRDLDINMGEITTAEVIKLTQRLKNGKAAGIDEIQAELLKHGGGKLTEDITRLCNRVWNRGKIPQDWQDGIIIPFPIKKGDL